MKFLSLLFVGILVTTVTVCKSQSITDDAPWSVFRKNKEHNAVNEDSFSQKPKIIAKIKNINSRQVILWDANKDGNLDIIATGYKKNGVVAISGKNPFSLLWTFQTQSPLWTVPSISDEFVYFGGGEKDPYYYCLNVHSGKLKWKTRIGKGVVAAACIVKDGKVIFGCEDQFIYAINTIDGSLKWKVKTGEVVRSSPVVKNNIVYIGSWDGFFYAIALTDGKVIWKKELGLWVHSSPTIFDEMIYVGVSEENSIVAVQQESGNVLWRSPTENIPDATVVVTNEFVYSGEIAGNNVYAIDRVTGKRKWTFASDGWTLSSPVISGDGIIFGSLGGTLYCLDRNTGKEMWKVNLLKEIRGNVVSHKRRIYISTDDNILYILE